MSGFVMGALVGAAFVFFSGTKRGKRMAKVMRQKGGQTLKDLEGLVKEIEEKGSTFTQKAKVATTELKKQAKSKQKQVATVAKKQLTHIKKLQQKGRAAAARYFKK